MSTPTMMETDTLKQVIDQLSKLSALTVILHPDPNNLHRLLKSSLNTLLSLQTDTVMVEGLNVLATTLGYQWIPRHLAKLFFSEMCVRLDKLERDQVVRKVSFHLGHIIMNIGAGFEQQVINVWQKILFMFANIRE